MSTEPALYPDLNQPYVNPSPVLNFQTVIYAPNTQFTQPPQFIGRPHSIVPDFTANFPGVQPNTSSSEQFDYFKELYSQYQCNIHQRPISHICKGENCPQRVLCELCKENHSGKNKDHKQDIIPAHELFDYSVLSQLNQLSQEEDPAMEPLDKRYQDISEAVKKAFNELRTRGEELLIQAEEKAQQLVKEYFMLGKDAHGWSDLRQEYLVKRDTYLTGSVGTQNKELEDFVNILNAVQAKKVQRELDIQENLRLGRDQMDKFIQRMKENITILTDTLFQRNHEDSQKPATIIDPTKIYYNKEVKGDHKYILNAMAYIPKVDQLITASECGYLTAWNPTTYAPITTYKVHSNAISTLLYVESESLLITGSKDKSIRLFPVNSNGINIKKPEVFTSHTGPVRSLLLLEGEDRFVSAGEDADLRIWHLKSRNLDTIISTRGWKTCGDEMAFIRPERWIAVTGKREIRIYDYVTRELIIRQNAMKTTGSLSFMNEKRFLAVQDDHDKITLWKLDSEKKRLKREMRLKLPEKSKKPVYFKSFEESDMLIASYGKNKVVVFDLTNGQNVKEIETKLQNTTSFTLLKNERRIAVGDAGSNLVGFLHY